jgi:uncharacterized phiE125 gp8 family phage protein
MKLDYHVNQTVPPAIALFTPDEVRPHIRESDTAEDGLLAEEYIPAAIAWCQAQRSEQFINATWQLRLPRWPGGLEREPWPLAGNDIVIERGPLVGVTSIAYLDTAGTSQTLASSVYTAVPTGAPPRIELAYGQSWPAVRDHGTPITITYVAGYGTERADVPANIRQAVLKMVIGLFEHRGALPDYISDACRALLFPTPAAMAMTA